MPVGITQLFYNWEVFDGCTALEKVTFYTTQEKVDAWRAPFTNCPNLKTIELLWVVECEYDENDNLIGYKEVAPAYFKRFNASVLAGTGYTRFYANGPSFNVSGASFAGSKVETVVIAPIGWCGLEGNWDTGEGAFQGADALKEVWFSLSEDGFYFAENTFVGVDHDINVYFTNYTLEDMMGMIGESGWYEYASEKVHFYFADTMPTDVEWPAELKSE